MARQFDRLADAVFPALLGGIAGEISLWAGASGWLAVSVCVIWTAVTNYGLSEPNNEAGVGGD